MNLIKIYLDSEPYGEKLSFLNVFMLYACTISHLFCQLMPHTRAKNLFSTERREKKSHDVMKNRNNLTRNNSFISISIFYLNVEKNRARISIV